MLREYEKIRIIGKGTFGLVHLFKKKRDDTLVAVKQISIHQITESEKVSTNNEVKVLAMLNHPHVVEYYNSFIEDDILSIIMEYAAGGTLGAYLKLQNNILLEQKEILNLFSQIVLGLEHIHSKNIVHRDLTTENIFLTAPNKLIKIGDFGISKVLASKTNANTVVGTPCYMSPELCEGKPYNYKSDIWALGCILYEIVTLKKAFEAPTLPNLIMKIMQGSLQPIEKFNYEAELYNLINLMLQLLPDKRPSISQIRVHPAVLKPLLLLLLNEGKV